VTIAGLRPGPRRSHFSANEAAVLALLKAKIHRRPEPKAA
jgi:hypothetical protein